MPLDEKTREEKEAYASKIMAEMKLKNEKLKERYKEVQKDRERAEERNSSITLGRNLRKDADKDFSPKTKPEREWDRGKPNIDSEDWDSKHHEYYPPKNSRVYSDRRDRRDDNWRSRPNASSSSRPTSSFFSKYHSNKNETVQESSSYRNDGNHFSNRPRSHYTPRNANDSHPNHNPKGEDYSRKISSNQTNSDFKRENASHRAEGADELMWQSGSMIEAQIKFNRIENWVKSINTNQGFPESTDAKNIKEEYKSHGRGRDLGLQEKPKKFGMNDDITPKKSKEQSYFRKGREYEGKSVEPISTRKKRIRERVSSTSDSKNFRDVKRKSITDRPRRKCESDVSDHASSMKESDDTIVHCGSKSNNFHQQDKKVHYDLQDPWGSDITSNENGKDFVYLEGDAAWVDWGNEQPKDVKQNSQSQNKNEYGTKPSHYNSKTKHTHQYEKTNWTESKHLPEKVSQNNQDFNQKSMHRRKSGNEFHSAHSQVPVSSRAVEVDLDGIWGPTDENDNQEEFNEEWGSKVEKNPKITSPPELCDNEVLVNQSLNISASSFDKKEDGWGSFESNHEGEMSKIIEPVAKQDSFSVKESLNNNEPIKGEENSNAFSPTKEQYLNSSTDSNECSEELKCNSIQSEMEAFSKPIIEQCDITNKKDSESVQSDQKMDYCNESSDSNSQVVNYEGSPGDAFKSVDNNSCIEKNKNQLDFKNLEELGSEEVASLHENLLYDEKCNHEIKEANVILSIESNISEENVITSKIVVENSMSSTVSASGQEKVHHKLESEHLNDVNVIEVSGEKVLHESHGEPDVGGSDEDGWSTVSEEEDEKNDCHLTS